MRRICERDGAQVSPRARGREAGGKRGTYLVQRLEEGVKDGALGPAEEAHERVDGGLLEKALADPSRFILQPVDDTNQYTTAGR